MGTNSPGFIDWMHASDLDEWSHIDTKSEGLSQSQWTINMPVEVREFEYYAKTIDAQLQPDMGQEIHEEPDYWDVDPSILSFKYHVQALTAFLWGLWSFLHHLNEIADETTSNVLVFLSVTNEGNQYECYANGSTRGRAFCSGKLIEL